ncbi:hypothetical protein DPMN_033178 [Dreissena polymorpha]|uniref:Uncharacterized protein n=1 Tax=Dreissena polymorpha TaxID=45954 RepID=A0A9D4RKX5_DREPO|nr:hypothetical protein DPMN_033178 [Dreissena polymorpha]
MLRFQPRLQTLTFLLTPPKTESTASKPSCLQTTIPSAVVNLSSQTVPHVPFTLTSTRPRFLVLPLTSRTFSQPCDI